MLKTSGAAEPDALAAALTALRLGDAAPAAAAGVACVGAACDLNCGCLWHSVPTDLLVQFSKAVHQLSQCQSADGQTRAL